MKQKNIPLFALSALLLFSGCNTDKAVTTSADATAVTEEVTKTATAEVTTAASTSTRVTTIPPVTEQASESETAEPEEATPEINQLTAELQELTKKYLLFSDICGFHLMAEKVATKFECNIYEWETVKTWDDFKQLMSDIFTGELYDSTIDHYNFSINMPERGSVMPVDGKIGYSVADDHTVPDPEIYDSSDIEVLSEDGDRITFRCAGTQHIGNISTGIDEHLYIRFDAVRTDDVLKIERVEYESDIGADRYSVTAIITDKLDELGKEVTEYIADSERGIVLAAVSALGNDTGYDIYRFSENTEEHLFTVPRNNLTRIARYTENGADFLIIYMAGAVGRGYPATVITIRDGEPVILSEYDPDDAEYTGLFYYPAYDLIGDRGVGISAGANSFIPYHWDGESFVPYRLHEIRKEYLKKLDADKVVPDIYSAVSVFFRENGLIHVNYREMSECEDVRIGDNSPIASRTFVYENGKLRKYDQESEELLGFYIGKLPVTDNIVEEGVPEDWFDIDIIKDNYGLSGYVQIEVSEGETPDISELAECEALSIFVNDVGMCDLSFVGELIDLKKLFISIGEEEPWKLPLPETHIKSYNFLKKLDKLDYLDLRGEHEFDLSCLDGLSSLTEVELHSCNITGHTHLENVQAVDTTLSYISADELVTSFPNVKYLHIDFIDSVAPLAGLESLEYLRVYLGTPLNDIAAVRDCPNLKFLDMTTDKVAPDDRFLLEMSDLMRLNYCFGTFTEETIEKLHEMYPYIEIRGWEPAF
ncbi:MAG: hypothetical protein J6O50_09985 [Ruminiclostridium sp.]|nr:hypothetical protein [Ruminiclostridium sp.]